MSACADFVFSWCRESRPIPLPVGANGLSASWALVPTRALVEVYQGRWPLSSAHSCLSGFPPLLFPGSGTTSRSALVAFARSRHAALASGFSALSHFVSSFQSLCLWVQLGCWPLEHSSQHEPWWRCTKVDGSCLQLILHLQALCLFLSPWFSYCLQSLAR